MYNLTSMHFDKEEWEGIVQSRCLYVLTSGGSTTQNTSPTPGLGKSQAKVQAGLRMN